MDKTYVMDKKVALDAARILEAAARRIRRHGESLNAKTISHIRIEIEAALARLEE